jgi:hypothetical protein
VTSKRDLKRDVEQLSEETTSGGCGLQILFGVKDGYETREEAPRPDLLVPDDARGGYTTTAPKIIPDKFETPIMIVTKAVTGTWPGDVDDSSIPVSALWDNLTDEQLREERRRRKENDEPVPPVLHHYDPKK